jgi:hypothetical protein
MNTAYFPQQLRYLHQAPSTDSINQEVIELPYSGATGTSEVTLVYPNDASTSALPYFDFSPMITEIDQILNLLNHQLQDDEDISFNAEIYGIVSNWGTQSINRIISLIRSSQIRGLFVSKLLQSLGDIVHPHTHLQRRSALEKFLFDPSARVRDGACLGLSVMDDASSLPYATFALQTEQNPILRKNLQSLISQLENGKAAGTFYQRST